MILPLLFALQQPAAPVAPSADRPIRIWMDATSPVSRGRGVRLYIQAATAGNLVVLHSRTDGRIEVLFPARPTDNPHLTPGTWELRGAGDAPVWTVSEPDGTGMILAALSPDPVWFDEFSRDAAWSAAALKPSWSGADAEGGMQDIVQRMLGDGSFTYDLLTYSVAPEAVAQGPQAPSDTFPTIDNTQPDDAALTTCGVSSPVQCQLLGQPLFLGARFRHHRFARGRESAGAPVPTTPQAVSSLVFPIHSAPAPSSSGPVEPRRRPVPEVSPRRRTAPPAPPAPTAPTPAGPAATFVPGPGVMRALVSRPVPGAAAGRLAGAAPAARSALVLRYVRPRAPESAPAGRGIAAVPAVGVGSPPLEAPRATPPVGTIAAAMPIRASGVTLMSRAMPARAALSTSSAVAAPVAARGAAAARMAPRGRAAAPAAPRAAGGVTGTWLVVPRRR